MNLHDPFHVMVWLGMIALSLLVWAVVAVAIIRALS